MRALLLLLALLLAAVPAFAQDDDIAALSLADKAAIGEPKRARNWQGFITGGWSRAATHDALEPQRDDAQVFAHLRVDAPLGRSWRVVFADLLTMQREEDLLGRRSVNTIIDAYASWQPGPDRIVDAGRINTRYGVATGFNPTDYFRTNSIRSVVSIDPASLRANRQGSVMLRGQALWPTGSITALYSPRLSDHSSDASFVLDTGATNPRDRWLVAVTHRLAAGIDPQWLLQGGAGQSPQLGLNLSALLGNAAVAYVETSMGRMPTQRAQAFGNPSDDTFRTQWAAGMTYTTPHNISLTVELEYNGAGLDDASLDALKRVPFAYLRYRLYTARAQTPPTKQRAFASVAWKDALVDRLDLDAFAYYDGIDSSRQYWAEARYRWTHDIDTALQWQLYSGTTASEFGSLPSRQVWQVLVTWYF